MLSQSQTLVGVSLIATVEPRPPFHCNSDDVTPGAGQVRGHTYFEPFGHLKVPTELTVQKTRFLATTPDERPKQPVRTENGNILLCRASYGS